MALLDAIHAQCKAFKPQLIVIDALYLFTPSRQNAGNDSASMGPVMAKLNAIAEALQAAVLLIAHDKKDGSDVAGSHVIRAAVKARLHLTRPQWGGTDEEADDGKRYLTVTTKMTAETKHLLRCQGAGSWDYIGPADNAMQARITWTKRKVQDYVNLGGEGTAKEIAKALNLRQETVALALSQLEEEGAVIRESIQPPIGQRGRPRLVYRKAGNLNPKEDLGTKIQGTASPAKNAGLERDTTGYPLINQAGTKIQPQKPAILAGCSNTQELSSHFPLSRDGSLNEEPPAATAREEDEFI